MTDITAVLTYTATEATAADLDRIINAVKTRRKFFGAARAATVTIGADVELTNLQPKVLNGLTGEVVKIHSNRCDVRLTEGATKVLAASGTKHGNAALRTIGIEPCYTLSGIPMQCCEIAL